MFRSEIIWHYRRCRIRSELHYPPIRHSFSTVRQTATNTIRFSTTIRRQLMLTRFFSVGREMSTVSLFMRVTIMVVSCMMAIKKACRFLMSGTFPYLNPKAKERVGYPTQKPILLLERIISLVTLPGDVVLDPFAGSGTALVAAQLAGRKAIGIDVSSNAVDLIRKRLDDPVKTSSELFVVGRKSYVQSDDDALAFLHGVKFVPVQRNRGIDALLKTAPGERPVFLRVQRKGESLQMQRPALCGWS